MERDLSYGELCALSDEFEKQCEYAGIDWLDDDPQIYIEAAPAGSYGIDLPF